MGSWGARLPLGLYIAALACGLLAAAPCSGEVQFKFTPKLILEQSFSDNFFLEEEDEVDMWIARVAPGFDLNVRTENSVVILDYMVGRYWHFANNAGVKTSDQDYFRHDLSLGMAHQPSSHWRLGFTEELISSREPLLSEELSAIPGPLPGDDDDILELIDVATRIDFTRNRIKPFVSHYFNDKWEARLNYRHETFDLSSNDPVINSLLEDQKEHRALAALSYNFDAGNHLDLEHQFWHRDFKPADPDDPANSDYDAYQVQLIYRRDMKGSPYEFEIGAGYQFRNFTQDISLGGGRFERMDDLNEFVFQAQVSRMTQTSRTKVLLERAINDFTISNNYYASHGIRILTEKTFKGSGFLLFGGGGYEFNNYINEAREDEIWQLQLGTGYRFFKEKLELRVGYEYTNRNSDRLDASYDENKAFFRLEAKHDIIGKR